VTPGTARPATARPAPRFTPAQTRIPRDPGARDHSWPDQWPLRTHLELAALDTAPGSARAHVSAVLREWQADADTADVAALVVSELLTNAVQSTQRHHLHDPVRLWMLGDRTSLLFLVWDATDPAPVLAPATPGKDEHGRGLEIVNALGQRWAWYYPDEQPYGKVTWALLRAASQPTLHSAVVPAWAQGKP
jgi:anti-sigma regulatory factor (Ser/Thr protein kinase)